MVISVIETEKTGVNVVNFDKFKTIIKLKNNKRKKYENIYKLFNYKDSCIVSKADDIKCVTVKHRVIDEDRKEDYLEIYNLKGKKIFSSLISDCSRRYLNSFKFKPEANRLAIGVTCNEVSKGLQGISCRPVKQTYAVIDYDGNILAKKCVNKNGRTKEINEEALV